MILPTIRTRQCRFPTINRGRDTVLPCPLDHSGAAAVDMTHSTADKLTAGKEEYASVDVWVPAIHKASSQLLTLVETTN